MIDIIVILIAFTICVVISNVWPAKRKKELKEAYKIIESLNRTIERKDRVIASIKASSEVNLLLQEENEELFDEIVKLRRLKDGTSC